MAKHPEHPEHIETLTRVHDEMQAGLIVAALEENGIKAVTVGDATADFRVGVPGDLEILVTEEDAAEAHEILKEIMDKPEESDSSP